MLVVSGLLIKIIFRGSDETEADSGGPELKHYGRTQGDSQSSMDRLCPVNLYKANLVPSSCMLSSIYSGLSIGQNEFPKCCATVED